MLMKNIKCTKCDQYYDTYLRACPKCGEPNFNKKATSIPKNILMFDIVRQIFLFVVGWAGLFIFSLIFTSIFIPIYSQITGVAIEELSLNLMYYPDLNFWINFATYILIFGILIIIIIPYIKLVFSQFKNTKNYMCGIILGLVLVGVNLLISYILGILNIGDNGNQENLSSMVGVSPVLSIVIFAIVGPICEELTYRLGLFSICQRSGKIWVSYLISTLIFGLIHFDYFANDMLVELANLPSYLFAGLILSFSYHKGGLPASIIAHIMNNVLAISTLITRN